MTNGIRVHPSATWIYKYKYINIFIETATLDAVWHLNTITTLFCQTVQYYIEYEANRGAMTHGNHLFMTKTKLFMFKILCKFILLTALLQRGYGWCIAAGTNYRYFTDDNFKNMFVNENVGVSHVFGIKICSRQWQWQWQWKSYIAKVVQGEKCDQYNTYDIIVCLTHWGRVTHICVSKLAIIGSDNGLSPGGRQATIWTNARILLIGPLGTNFDEILIGIQTFLLKKMH